MVMIDSSAGVGREQLLAALRTINELQDELRGSRASNLTSSAEPIAIVGRSLRMPGGADSPDSWWPLLRDEMDATSTFPPARADAAAYYDPDRDHPGTTHVIRGGFLDHVDGFDPAVFGISPREAVGMDPQQRMALELCWESLEDGGIAPDQLADSATGVFIGVSTTDYARMRQRLGDIRDIDAYQLIAEPSFIAGRISYTFGLQGPSSVVDTACSSSLVALHQAVRSLRLRESDLALAGGVNLLLDPYGFVLMSKFKALALDGRCKTFDDSADGYARGEGGGVITLQRLDDALAERRVIHGVIVGTAVNHDGNSSGMTVPNPQSQQKVMRTALRDASLTPEQIDYVEAHGTGTALGDPIELRSIHAVYGQARPDRLPVVVGSVKSNIGHLEPAAGIAGLLKVLLSFEHGQIPANLHLVNGNSKVDWDQLAVTVPTTARTWTRSGRPRIAAISSFGASGTNAHTLVQEGPEAPKRAGGPSRSEALILSARTASSLQTLARRYDEHLSARPEQLLADICWTTQSGRARLEHGLCVLGSTPEQLQAGLRDHLAGVANPAVHAGRRGAHADQRSAWMFTGQGAQFPNMAAGLREIPAFEAALRECLELFDPALDLPLAEVIWGSQSRRLDDTAYTQPALFTIEYALARLLIDVGLRPSVLIGHSIGEIVAATVAGVLTLPDAVALVAARGRLMSALPSGGAMLAVSASEATLASVVGSLPDRVDLAAVNSPSDLVLSGAAESLGMLSRTLSAAGLKVTPLTVSHAFHSCLLEPMMDDFRKVVGQIPMQSAQIPLISSLTGLPWDDRSATPEYWIEQARGTVQFAAGAQFLASDGVNVFVEIGPHPVLTGLGQRSMSADAVAEQQWVSPLRRGGDDRAGMMGALGRLQIHGLAVDWRAVHADVRVSSASLPTYAWERQRYWFTVDELAPRAAGTGAAGLGQQLGSAAPTWQDTILEPVPAPEQVDWVLSRAHRALAAAGIPDTGPDALQVREEVVFPPPTAVYPYLVQTSVETLAPTSTPTSPDRREVVIRTAAPEQAAAGAEWQLLARVGVEVRDQPIPAGRAPWYPQDQLLLSTAWQELPARGSRSTSEGVLLVGGPPALAQALAEDLRSAGATVRLVPSHEVLGLLSQTEAGPDRVVLLDASALPAAEATTATTLIEQALPTEQLVMRVMQQVAASSAVGSQVSILTRGAVRIQDQAFVSPAGSPLWGLGRVLALEHPLNWGGLVDIDPDVDIDDPVQCVAAASVINDALLTGSLDDQQAQRGRQRLGARVRPEGPATGRMRRTDPLLTAPGTVLITGGLGGIGLALVGWCAAHGVGRLVLTSRYPEPGPSSPDANQPRWLALRQLRARGLDIRVEAVDGTDSVATAALIERLAGDEHLPLRGVIHAAGVSHPQLVVAADEQSYRQVWAPKVLGAWALHEATRELDLDVFVLFSSIAASWGSQHLASYAAGNAFLDGLAQTRSAQGLPVTAVAWGPWALPSSLFGQDVMDFLASVGLRELAADQCLTLLGQAIASRRPHQIVCAADWSRYRPVMEARRSRPILHDLSGVEPIASGAAASRLHVVLAAGDSSSPARVAAMNEVVIDIVASVLGQPSGSIDPGADIFALGLDSVMVMEVTAGCRQHLGLTVAPSALFERSTPAEWTDHLLGLLEDSGQQSAPRAGVDLERIANLVSNAELPADIVAAVPLSRQAGLGQRVLLTGASGFVGAYLLRELLSQNATRIVDCLIRGTDPAIALRRILDNAARYFPAQELDPDRIRVVTGDLSREGLGLSAQTRQRLVARTDSVVHNGAGVNFVHTYQQLRPANIDGTIELLRMAAEGGAALHHVSTYGIWGMPTDRDRVLEDESILTAGRLVTGYVQTKWAAEHVVQQAGERGVPVAIYRLGRVLGDTVTGAALTTHFTCRVIKSCIQLGAAPDLDIAIEMTPVDYVAQSLVSIADSQVPSGQAYHLVNPVHMPFRDLVASIREHGWAVDTVPTDQWWQRLLDTQGHEPNELHSVMPIVQEMIVGGERAVDYDTKTADGALSGTGVSCPPLDRSLLDRYFDYFLSVGYLTR